MLYTLHLIQQFNQQDFQQHAAVGAISPTEQTMGLTGVSATAAVGAIAPTEQTMGLTGVSATVTLSPSGVAPIGWGRVTAAQTGNYSKITATQTGGYTKTNNYSNRGLD